MLEVSNKQSISQMTKSTLEFYNPLPFNNPRHYYSTSKYICSNPFFSVYVFLMCSIAYISKYMYNKEVQGSAVVVFSSRKLYNKISWSSQKKKAQHVR